MESLRKEAEIEVLKLKGSYSEPLKDIQATIDELTKQIAAENELLERAKGSFCEWLDENVPDWAETIGKVADERRILYHTALSPQLSNQTDGSLFGVNIDLSEIETSVRTPQQIEAARNDLANQQNQAKKQLSELLAKQDEEIRQIEGHYAAKIKELRETFGTTEQLLQTLPGQQKRAELLLS